MKLATSEVAAMFGAKLDGLPYAQRLTGPAWATGELVAGDGHGKLSAWLAAAPAAPWDRISREKLLVRIHGYGDFLPACSLVADVLEGVPLPVQEYLIERVTFVGAGLGMSGFAGPPPPTDDRPWYIVVSGACGNVDSVRAVIAHECAHSWTLPEPTAGALLSAGEMHAYRTMSEATVATEAERCGASGMVEKFHRLRSEDRERERLAERLARSWGYLNPWEYQS